MFGKLMVGVALACVSQYCGAQTQTTDPAPSQQAQGAGICLFTGTPPADHTYTTLRKLKYGKGSYGSVNDILPMVIADAKAAGADAVIHYNGSQRFGFWPWRFVRPVVTGTAIKWEPARNVDCAAAGGHYSTGTLAEAPPPPPK